MYGTERLDKVRHNINDVQEKSSSGRKWTDEERQIIEDMIWEGWSYKDIQKSLPDRSIIAIKAEKYRMESSSKWKFV